MPTRLIIFSVMAMMFQVAALAQETESKTSFWLSAALGLNTLDGEIANIDLNLLTRKKLLLTFYAGLAANDAGNREEMTIIRQSGLLVGKTKNFNNGLGSVGIGLSYLFIDQRLEDRKSHNLGIPFMIKTYLIAFNNVGLGLAGYVNFNRELSYGALSLSLAIGRFK